MTAGLVLGVDGGATKTIALVCDGEGRVIGWGRSGNADIYQTAKAERHVAEAIATACKMAGAVPADISAAALSLVGADWPEDMTHWRARAGDLGLGHLGGDRLVVVNDAIGALSAGVPTGAAVAFVCGSGTAVGARGADGTLWHSSFWQRRQGAVVLARAALDSVYEAELGIADATSLTQAALAHFGVSSVAELLHQHTARGAIPTRSIGSFAPRLLDEAMAGDAAALHIVGTHAAALAPYATLAARCVGLEPGAPISLMLAGGVFRHPLPLLRQAVIDALGIYHPDLTLVTAAPEPVAGAIALAQGCCDTDAPRRLRPTVIGSLPPAAFFATDTNREA